MSDAGKLITIIPKRPNPLFEDFLSEFIRDASGVEKTNLENALNSLKKFPILLSRADDCFILEYFTRDLCERLDIRWKRHRQASVNADYIPLLVWIFTKEQDPNYKGFLTVGDVSENFTSHQSEAHVLLLQSVLQNYLSIENDRYQLTTSGRELARKHSNVRKRTVINEKIPIEGSETSENAAEAPNIMSVLAPTKRVRKKPTKTQLDVESSQIVGSQLSSNGQAASSQSAVESQPADSQSTISNSQGGSQVPEEQIVFLPGSFTIYLLIDTAETTSELSKTTITKILTDMSIPHEIRHLNVGDYLWIARDQNNKELVLPYIVERKRIDDFCHSIKDGRYHEQKHRLKETKLNVIYIIEKCKYRGSMSEETLIQATINTLVNDKFHVKETDNLKETASHLARVTQTLTGMFSDSLLNSCPKEMFQNDMIEPNGNSYFLPTFKGFVRGMSKTRNYTVKEMLIKHLIQLNGMSVDKAAAIVGVYPTPCALMRALRNDRDVIANIPFGPLRRKIGPKISKILHAFYTNETFPE